MALSNFSDLKSSIADWLNREDLTSVIPDFITGCEQAINYGTEEIEALRIVDMETEAVIAGTAGVYALPADYLEFRSVICGDEMPVPLSLATPEWLALNFPLGYSARARYFKISGGDLISYYSADADISMTYYAKVPALSVSNSTNWLLTKAPMVYLYGSLLQAAPYLGDDARIATWAALFKQYMGGLRKSDRQYRHSKIVTRVKGPTP